MEWGSQVNVSKRHFRNRRERADSGDVINLKLQLVKTISVGASPVQVVFTPNGTRAYVIFDEGSPPYGYLAYIDTALEAREGIARDRRFNGPFGLAITPDGATLYVTQTDRIYATGREKEGVIVFDTASNQIRQTSLQL